MLVESYTFLAVKLKMGVGYLWCFLANLNQWINLKALTANVRCNRPFSIKENAILAGTMTDKLSYESKDV